MVHGSFSGQGIVLLIRIKDILNLAGYCNKDYILPHCKENMGKNYYFQQDNAPVHKSKNITALLKAKKIKMLEWPPQSPDWNPIENLWFYIKRSQPKDLDQLFIAIEQFWNS